MSIAPNITLTFGTTSGGSPVSGVVDPGNAWNVVHVTLSANYIQQNPQSTAAGIPSGGFPSRPPAGTVWSPQTILSGDRRQYWNCEALAIVAAGLGALS
jgi:hypothetical protein